MASRVVTDVNGDEHLAVMQYRREECGGLLSVNQQIRDAIRGHLCGLVYMSLYKQ